MFRWCSFCQRLIGEVAPYDDYSVTHGMCAACAARPDPLDPRPGVLVARDLFDRLAEAGRGGDLEASEAAVDAALAAGLPPSDVIVGVLHPALGWIGQLWASGAISVADEHRFTDFALRLIDRLRFVAPPTERPLVLLALLPENRHDVGLRMLQVLAWERGMPCVRLPAGSSMEEIAGAAVARRAALLGLSVGLRESLAVGLAFARELRQAIPDETTLVLGGLAFRHGDTRPPPEGIEVLLTVDAYAARLERLAEASGRTTDGPG